MKLGLIATDLWAIGRSLGFILHGTDKPKSLCSCVGSMDVQERCFGVSKELHPEQNAILAKQKLRATG